ncbi:MAG: DUF1512 family protein [Promethearchaeota archaeon]
MSQFTDFLAQFNNFLTTFFIILLLLVFFYGQNWQGWYAGQQIKKSLKGLNKWKKHGINLIRKIIEPISPEGITTREINDFINRMLDFFVIPPVQLDPPIYGKLRYLMSYREERYSKLIKHFLPNIDKSSLATISALLNATTEIHNLHKKVRHNLIIGEKTKSYLFLLSTASEITQIMIKARAYRTAIDSFIKKSPIGDSIGPMAVNEFLKESQKNNNLNTTNNNHFKMKLQKCDHGIYSSEIIFEERRCICLRPNGPDVIVGNIGEAVENVIIELREEKVHPSILISIDAITRLEGEKLGTVAQGLGVVIGGDSNNLVDKYQIETLCMKETPSIPYEAIVCRESLEEAVSPMSEPIILAIPKIIRTLKQIIRSQTKPNDIVLILGIGNAIGVSFE